MVFGGKDLNTVSEDSPYPGHFTDPFTASIAVAEKAVLSANADASGSGSSGSSAMMTCSVRAASVYGPGGEGEEEEPAEDLLLSGLASRARAGARPIGSGKNVVDFVYAGNVAHALLLAAQSLLLRNESTAAVAGRAFFVTDMEPVPYAEFASRALSRLGYPAPGSAGGRGSGGIPVLLATVLAFLLQVVALVVSPFFEFRPALTAGRVAEESTVRRFDTSRATRDLGYTPLWNQEVCMLLCVCVWHKSIILVGLTRLVRRERYESERDTEEKSRARRRGYLSSVGV